MRYLVGGVVAAAMICAASVRAQSVSPVADTGTADAGIASRPIANVAANDTVNGSPATLGTSGNATIAKLGTWPAGIALTNATGLVSTSTGVAPAIYNVQYSLCDRSQPPTCASTMDTITVISPSIIVIADTGSGIAGIASTAIRNVASNDTVNGSPATLGTSGTSSVAKVGTWPTGIALNYTTGAVTISAAVTPGTYSVQYNLCDKNKPAYCVNGTDTVTVVAPSVVAIPESGSANAGTSSIAIAHVVANDTVNGLPAKLGTSGNSSVAKSGSWPAGLSLTAATGAVITSASLAPGVYYIQYSLCNKGVPPTCASATDTVTVVASSVSAVSDTGGADVGVASTPIPNVTANDTVNGGPAILGTGGNAIVSQSGSWPSEISLNPATGAVVTTAALGAGIYSFQYTLCNQNVPQQCAAATDTVTAISASIGAAADSGIATVGTMSTPIMNVAANDTITGAPATLGVGGNATVSQSGTWPNGITLDTTAGAISASSSVSAGTHQVQYQLCDRNNPAVCALATDTILVSLPFTEVQVSTTDFADLEFDWGRDGIYCPTCNYGQGNARFNWSEKSNSLWVGHVDPVTGMFTPPEGKNELVDTWNFYYLNGPEWAFSTQNGQVLSQLIYSRITPGQPVTTDNAGVAFATPTANGWTTDFLPGAGPAAGGSINTVNPIASQCNADPVALALFNDLQTPRDAYWEAMTTAGGTAPNLTPFGSYYSVASGGKPGIRWVPCKHQLVFVGAAPPDASGNVYQQVFWYDIDSQIAQQLTTEPTQKTEAAMFQAPEFQDNYIFYTITNDTEIDIYEQTGVAANGAPTFQVVNRISSTDPTEPYIGSTEAFINCAPACQTYIFMKISAQALTPKNRHQVANGVAVTKIDPLQPLFQILVPYWATPTIERTDLEYYITASGPFVYYGSNTIASSGSIQLLGHFYVDMKLGAPSGSCVGSSAQGGLLPGC